MVYFESDDDLAMAVGDETFFVNEDHLGIDLDSGPDAGSSMTVPAGGYAEFDFKGTLVKVDGGEDGISFSFDTLKHLHNISRFYCCSYNSFYSGNCYSRARFNFYGYSRFAFSRCSFIFRYKRRK